MKILLARMNHETNTFSPIETPLASFGDNGPLYGDEAYQSVRGTRTGIGAFIDLAEAAGHEVVVAISATANPSARVQASAYSHICDTIVAAARGCDAVMLDLHGAMVAENTDDGEGMLLERIREVLPDAPLAVALDLHGKMTDRIINHADVVISFKTYPHIDMYETGEHAGRLLLDKIAGRAHPVMAWRRLPLMVHTLCSRTDLGPMHHAVNMAKEAEASGMLGVSVLAGFSLADIAAPCISVVVVADGDQQAAEKTADKIADYIWENRQGFIYHSEPLSTSISRARELAAQPGSGPVLLLDHGDNCMSGGTCDDMHVLHEALAQGLADIAVGPICDPEAVEIMISAGVGQTVTLKIGNKVPLTQLGIHPISRELTGTISRITDGEYIMSGPTYTGQRMRMGRTVRLDTPAAQIIVTETPHEHWDLGIFEHIGIDPTKYSYVLLKSRMYCRPVFVPIAKSVVECDGGGVTSSDYSIFPFASISRPVYPLDSDTVYPSRTQ